MSATPTIYFHSPCLDGIASGVLAWDFLEASEGWSGVELIPVNYHLREHWLDRRLADPCAVVDFLYHPQPRLWADHHPTTFLSDEADKDYQRHQGPWRVYDPSAGSCAGLLWRHLDERFGHRNPSYEELVAWTEVTDAARYRDAEQAMRCEEPALRINAGLAFADDADCRHLVRLLRTTPLDEVARQPEIDARYVRFRSLSAAGLERLRQGAWMDPHGIVHSRVATDGVIVGRYAPFYLFPEARYSIAVLASGERVKVTAMKNPWRTPDDDLGLGPLFAQLGGGGHERIGSVLLEGARAGEADGIADWVSARIRSAADARATA